MNAKEELHKKLAAWEKKIGELAYQKIQIEKDLSMYEGALQAGRAVLADMTTEEAINQSKKKEEETNNV
jgi:Zn/Cd-binding protein ZinT